MTDQKVETKKWEDFEVAEDVPIVIDWKDSVRTIEGNLDWNLDGDPNEVARVAGLLETLDCPVQVDVSKPDADEISIVRIENLNSHITEVMTEMAESMRVMAQRIAESFAIAFDNPEIREAIDAIQLLDYAQNRFLEKYTVDEVIELAGSREKAITAARNWNAICSLCHPTRSGILTGNGYTSGGAE